jgi:hypothetical protein
MRSPIARIEDFYDALDSSPESPPAPFEERQRRLAEVFGIPETEIRSFPGDQVVTQSLSFARWECVYHDAPPQEPVMTESETAYAVTGASWAVLVDLRDRSIRSVAISETQRVDVVVMQQRLAQADVHPRLRHRVARGLRLAGGSLPEPRYV